ncbi:MAG: hypothetical protein IJO85_12060 [Lachnospiraceae bacterium]|nr:hypothetical protein [Lachnospiraceae bacterium]
MTVNGMMLLSKVFLGMMIFFLIAAIVVFFSLDVRKAWCMLTGKRVPAHSRKKESVKAEHKNNKANKYINRESTIKEVTAQTRQAMMDNLSEMGMEATALLHTSESIDNHIEGYDPTTILTDNEGETTVLAETVAETTILSQKQDNSTDIVMDITFIHTEITL